jgi:hypothetical protein
MCAKKWRLIAFSKPANFSIGFEKTRLYASIGFLTHTPLSPVRFVAIITHLFVVNVI